MNRACLIAALLVSSSALAQVRLPAADRDKIFPDRLPPNVNVTVTVAQPTHWDFEDGTLQGWTTENVPTLATGAFERQPTLGDNVSAERAFDTSAMAIPATHPAKRYLERLKTDLERMKREVNTVGGSYWNTPFPIGKQGMYWIGTGEARSKIGATAAWGTRTDDRKTGRMISPTIEVKFKFLHFLVGGGCSTDVGVYLQAEGTRLSTTVATPIGSGGGGAGAPRQPTPGQVTPTAVREWQTQKDAAGKPIEARGVCVENMVRVVFDVSRLKGTKVRLVIEDKATGAWGHINVDDIWITDTEPVASSRDRDPVWGVADLHAHLMNEKAYAAYNDAGTSPDARLLWGSALGPLSGLGRCNDTHTTSGWGYSSVQDEAFGSTYTLCRDVCINMIDGAGLEEFPGDQVDQAFGFGGYHDTNGGYPNFTAWPMWWSATHQQMNQEWVKRAYQGGVRLVVAAVGNSEIMSFAIAKEQNRQFTSDQDALALQIPAIKEFARQNRTWVGVASTPRQARQLINEGKLALVIGVELDHVIDSCNADITRQRHHTASEVSEPSVWTATNRLDIDWGQVGAFAGALVFDGRVRVMHVDHPDHCTDDEIEARIDALYRAGVRQMLPMHFSDNMLGGYAITGDLFTASAIFGDGHGARPELMSQADLVTNFGPRAAAFQPVRNPVTPDENERRKREWQAALPIHFKLPGFNLPIWARLGTGALIDGGIVPEGPGRALLDALTGSCIEDDGLRWLAAFASGGATEAACGISMLTEAALDAMRSTLPYEGVLDTAAMIPVKTTGAIEELAFHVNARGLQHEGEVFVRQMMRRGMLVDLQHSSEMTKRGILGLTQAYPVMASHGGVGGATENQLTGSELRTIYAPPNGFHSGLIGVGTQSTRGLIATIRTVLTDNTSGASDRAVKAQSRSVALGTDLNGMDWHAPPRFGKFAYYHPTGTLEPADERRQRQAFNLDGGIGPMVKYDTYAASTNPWSTTLPTCGLGSPATCSSWATRPEGEALHPSQVVDHGAVTRTFDINYDGLAHYGLLPDFMQEMKLLGAAPEEMGALFRSAEGTIQMWEEGCFMAYAMPSPPTSLTQGCGPASLYR